MRFFARMVMQMPKDVSKLPQLEFDAFVKSFDIVLSDCDGVLWLNNDVIKDSENVLNQFREMQKRVMFVTNNSLKTRQDLLEKCHKLGFNANQEDVICTSHLAATYLSDLKFKKKVFVIGTQGLVKELDNFGVRHIGVGPDTVGDSLGSYVETKLRIDPEVGCVLAAFDEHFSYPKMLKAACYLNDPNCLFLGTNTDERVPVSENLVMPGTGSIIRCLETLSGREALVFGKPNDYIKSAVVEKIGVDSKRVLMIGDRSNTDILFGRRCGFQTLLVLTGVTKLQEVQDWSKSDQRNVQDLVPNYYCQKLGDILQLLKKC